MVDGSSFGCAPEGHFGPLTLSDLANRAEVAHTEHMQGYTASAVLHRMHMAESAEDTELRDALDLLLARLETWRARTREEWRQAYNAWAVPAGVEPLPGDPMVVDIEVFVTVDEFDDVPFGSDLYDLNS
ncbi:hypothetical protein Ga0074812_13913 [Parafrankia irregularis]|uniref:Uncharacterized protein n=1 Tax=Parafrankia irregularis TaxID=795642 RepID=A0A0S4QZI8_9ACTN|nr:MULTISPECIES: hypothetical protein [Parafrankia]MBE3206419.1 hypothetical protein [Parafrankia sp. CH37]CUU60380.1 hypothetical protein Ga0074812_13913 [Parafrankia irregularis]